MQKLSSKSFNRNVVAPLAYHSGALGLMFRRRPARVILNYHGVTRRQIAGVNSRHMPVQQFERDLRFLRRHFAVVPLTEIFDEYRRGIPTGRSKVSLTFDDGYANNFEVALPILERYGTPVTFFIITEALRGDDYMSWSDLVDFVLWRRTAGTIEYADQAFCPSASGWISERTGRELREVIKSSGEEREAALVEFRRRYRAEVLRFENERDYWRLMSPAQVQACAASGLVEIGSHGHRHYNLGRVGPSLVEHELRTSKVVLEDLLQGSVPSLAYPDGDYTPAVKGAAARAGYEYQCAVAYREAEDRGDPRILNRFSISNSTTHESNMIRLAVRWKDHSF